MQQMHEPSIVWSVDRDEELVAMIGMEVICRIAPGTSAWLVKRTYFTTLRSRFENDRRSGDDRRQFLRDDGRERRSGTW